MTAQETPLKGYVWNSRLGQSCCDTTLLVPHCRKAEYQVLYVEDRLMSEAEQEDSKIIRADERF